MKIAPRYSFPVIHVLDASRSVVVVRATQSPLYQLQCSCSEQEVVNKTLILKHGFLLFVTCTFTVYFTVYITTQGCNSIPQPAFSTHLYMFLCLIGITLSYLKNFTEAATEKLRTALQNKVIL